jgi:hypothetical protein
MKTLILTLSFTLMSLLTFGTKTFSSQKDSLYCIEIDGRVLIPKGENNKMYKIELLCHNDVVDSGYVVDDESFLLKVKKNSWYTIRIIKEGYFPMVVSIDTRLPDYNKESHRFHFDTELIVENYSSIQDKDAIDFPIAIVSFNPKNDTFTPIKQYSKNIKRSLFEEQVVNSGYAKR